MERASTNLTLNDYNRYIAPYLVERLDNVDTVGAWKFEPNETEASNSTPTTKQEITGLFNNIRYFDTTLEACPYKDSNISKEQGYEKIIDDIKIYSEFLESILDEIKCRPLEGIVAGLLWCFRSNDKSFKGDKFVFAEKAIDTYTTIIDILIGALQEYRKKQHPSDTSIEASGVLIEERILLYSKRSLIIVSEVNNNKLIQKVLKSLNNLISITKECCDDEFVIELTSLFPYIKKTNQEWIKPYLDKVIAIAEKQQEDTDPVCYSTWKLAESLNKMLPKSISSKINFKGRQAKALIGCARYNIPHMNLKQYLKAFELYKCEKFFNEYNGQFEILKDKCIEWQKTNMHEVSSPQLKIPNPALPIESTNILQKAIDYLFSREYWLDKNEIEEAESEQTPGISDFVEKMHHVDPKTKQATTHTRDIMDYSVGYYGSLLQVIIEAIAKKYKNDIEKLEDNTLKKYLNKEYSCVAGEKIAEFEELLRNFVHQQGHYVYNIRQGNEEVKSLSAILTICNKNKLLDADLVPYTLNYLFTPKGANCRNLVYHGKKANNNILCYLCWVVIQMLRKIARKMQNIEQSYKYL